MYAVILPVQQCTVVLCCECWHRHSAYMQVPMAMLVDPLLKEHGWWTSVSASILELSGAASILSGFFWLNFNS